MHKPELRIIWSELESAGLYTTFLINEDRGNFVIEKTINGPGDYNYRQRWIAPLGDMLRAFGVESYTELATYLEDKYKDCSNALGEIKAESEAKGVKFEYTS